MRASYLYKITFATPVTEYIKENEFLSQLLCMIVSKSKQVLNEEAIW